MDSILYTFTSANLRWLSAPPKTMVAQAGSCSQLVQTLSLSWASLVAQMVKNLPAKQKTWARSLGWEDILKKGMATHSSILAWRIPWTEEPGGLQSMAAQRVRHDWATDTFTFMSWISGCVSKPKFFVFKELKVPPRNRDRIEFISSTIVVELCLSP